MCTHTQVHAHVHAQGHTHAHTYHRQNQAQTHRDSQVQATRRPSTYKCRTDTQECVPLYTHTLTHTGPQESWAKAWSFKNSPESQAGSDRDSGVLGSVRQRLHHLGPQPQAALISSLQREGVPRLGLELTDSLRLR